MTDPTFAEDVVASVMMEAKTLEDSRRMIRAEIAEARRTDLAFAEALRKTWEAWNNESVRTIADNPWS